MRFGDFLRRRIFIPLGMTNTVAYEKGRKKLRIAPTAIRERPRDGVRPIRVRLRPPWRRRSLYLTRRLAKWDAALAGSKLLTAKEMDPAFTRPLR